MIAPLDVDLLENGRRERVSVGILDNNHTQWADELRCYRYPDMEPDSRFLNVVLSKPTETQDPDAFEAASALGLNVVPPAAVYIDADTGSVRTAVRLIRGAMNSPKQTRSRSEGLYEYVAQQRPGYLSLLNVLTFDYLVDKDDNGEHNTMYSSSSHRFYSIDFESMQMGGDYVDTVETLRVARLWVASYAKPMSALRRISTTTGWTRMHQLQSMVVYLTSEY